MSKEFSTTTITPADTVKVPAVQNPTTPGNMTMAEMYNYFNNKLESLYMKLANIEQSVSSSSNKVPSSAAVNSALSAIKTLHFVTKSYYNLSSPSPNYYISLDTFESLGFTADNFVSAVIKGWGNFGSVGLSIGVNSAQTQILLFFGSSISFSSGVINVTYIYYE